MGGIAGVGPSHSNSNPFPPPARAEKSNDAMVAEHCKRSVRSAARGFGCTKMWVDEPLAMGIYIL